jgi:peptide chain release factor subunit 3
VEECEVTKLVAVIDPKTKEKKKAKFAKTGSICIVRVAVEKAICIEAFDNVAQVGGWVGQGGWLCGEQTEVSCC